MRRALIAVIPLVMCLPLVACSDDFKDTCEGQGGIVKEDTKTVVTVINGKAGTTFITVRLCVVNGEIVATA